ncbi:hypothetical protein A2164_04125 [Candidatus Curtissbacteria bacterium RBG_13_35_7]|uniref:AI-2E family transporter n=1 Tax=Candidatus Curtissbacteria bacterium RBG_13_35_7 TaxID=1797705 RepID=A0A1F5G137_9BACT|nr:MAG: hypothetical protein A2164_04125 [Candidatus Curtissbacteria bacterium RBG_13_35_7]
MTQDNLPTRIEISYKTVIFTVAVLIGLWFLVQVREIIILIFLSIIFLSALLKPVNWLNSRHIPRVFSVLIVYILVIAFIAFAIGIIIPPLVSQTTDFISGLPQILSTINEYLIFHNIPIESFSQVVLSQVEQFTDNIISISKTIISSIFLLITLLVITFYLLMEWRKFTRLFTSPFSGRQEKKIASIIAKVETGLGHWIRGQLTLSLVIGILTFIGLTILGIPFALPLALIAGILEIIPIIGPIVASIPAILVGLTVAPIMGLAVAALFFIIQQLENHFIVPMVMAKAVGLQPPIVIVALLIGAKLAGVGGAFLAVPIIVVARIIIQEILAEDQKLESGLIEG